MEPLRLRARRIRAAQIPILVAAAYSLASGSDAVLAHAPPGAAAETWTARSSAATSAAGIVVRLHQRVVRVTIHNFMFAPARLVVSLNTRIVWTNGDGDPHTVTSDRGVWASGALDTGNQFARTFKTAGTFPYHCAIHPFMHGSVTVKR